MRTAHTQYEIFFTFRREGNNAVGKFALDIIIVFTWNADKRTCFLHLINAYKHFACPLRMQFKRVYYVYMYS